MDDKIIIRESGDLNKLLKNHRLNIIPKNNPLIVLKLDYISDETNELLGNNINKWYYTCGCNEGAILVFINLIFIAVYYIAVFKGTFHLYHIYIWFISLFFCATIGKIIGMIIGKLRSEHIINTIYNSVLKEKRS